jgi:hypothetical protein
VRFYKFLFAGLPCDQALYAMWKSKCLPKLRVFTWLLFRDRFNTKDIMPQKHWQVQGGSACVLCASNILKSRDHLFFHCLFAQACWESIEVQWNDNLSISNRWVLARQNFHGPCFTNVFACAAGIFRKR